MGAPRKRAASKARNRVTINLKDAVLAAVERAAGERSASQWVRDLVVAAVRVSEG